MAVTSIWRVRAGLRQVVQYVKNPEKTDNPLFTELALSDVIHYAIQQGKTAKTQVDEEGVEIMQQFVSGVNCHPGTAIAEMTAVKKRFGKPDGIVAYHGYQSFAPGEATPEMAHEIGVKLAKRLWGDRYQVVVATHLDKKNHLHSHFVLNTVSFVDGIKYHRTAKDYHDMQAASDTLCREYGLSVIENPQRGKSKHYGEWRAEQEQRPTWRGIVRADVDEAIRQARTERQFFGNLRKKGYEIKMGKDISVRPPKKERFVRLERNFGSAYSIEGIRARILSQSRPERPLPEPEQEVRHAKFRGDFQKAGKITGFRALYFHYCYLLGIFPKNRPQNRRRLHFLLREDLLKLEAISNESKLLVVNRIDTDEQLFSYKCSLERRIETLTSKRAELYRRRRTVAVTSNPGALEAEKAEISTLSREVTVLRREVRLCDDIAVRSGVMREKIKAVREDAKSQGKEKQRNEQFRRRGGAGREAQS